MQSEVVRGVWLANKCEAARIDEYLTSVPRAKEAFLRLRRYWTEYLVNGSRYELNVERWECKLIRNLINKNFRTLSWLRTVPLRTFESSSKSDKANHINLVPPEDEKMAEITVAASAPNPSDVVQTDNRISDPIVVASLSSAKVVSGTDMWLPDLTLQKIDKTCIETNGWLGGAVIDAALQLLRNQFPQLDVIGGLQNTWHQLKEGLWPCYGKSLQILHIHGNHWVCVTSPAWNEGKVLVYDSLCGEIPDRELNQLLVNLYPNHDPAEIYFVDCLQQPNTNDCGVFAIATAVHLAFQNQSLPKNLDVTRMRQHLIRCFEARELSVFPVK